MLATCLHMMQGTPYVYQGEELGMTNMEFNTVEDFCDIESINAYHEYVDSGKIDGETMMRYLRYKSRDNSRNTHAVERRCECRIFHRYSLDEGEPRTMRISMRRSR